MHAMRKWSFCLSLLLCILNIRTGSSNGSDTLSAGQSVSVNQSLISEGGTFELGFFRPGASLNMYLGIWYKNFADKIIVWVANRESPLNTASLKLELSPDGNLVLLTNFTETVWSTALKSPILNSTEARLLDNGNLVIRDVSNTSITYWQSFDYPTDTWLPGGKLDWRTNKLGRCRGLFHGKTQKIQHQGFTSIPEMRVNIYNFSVISNENESYFTYSMSNTSILSRFVMDTSGKMMQWLWLVGSSQWSLYWSQPTDQADVYAFCGAFGVFNESTTSPCNCIKGFKPFRQNDWSSGCVRESPLQCQKKEGNGRKDEFLKMSNLTLPTNSKTHESANATRCEVDCLESCSCTAFAYNNSECFVWEGDLVNLQQLVEAGVSRAGADIYIKLAAAEFQVENGAGRGNKRRIRAILAVVIPVTFITFGPSIYCCYLRKRKLPHKGTSWFLLSFQLPHYESVSAVTELFSHKLGEGGFGPVYKRHIFFGALTIKLPEIPNLHLQIFLGKLSNGVEVAVKRLSKGSGQGLEEFRNETILIAKLQHRNLVRLLDANKRQILDWGSRIRIIEGIAQGLLYLHRYSNLRIIHRDLKPSNILLDSEMNPQDSDFGMARIFGGSETEANTKKIVGTHGYMSPEYAMDGLFSIKSDVFSFGVLLLEIVSGRKSTGFYHRDCLNLLGQAWKSWDSRRALDMMDPVLGNPPSTSVLLRQINIGLLCVQESPADRPTMSDVFSMIVNENAPLPAPKQPAFAMGRNMGDTSSSMSSAGLHSVNNLTVTMMDAR
uniref:Receptor-like serine/threonine-protein kinase n=1 Tax=Salix viminalis TaxID=40686 RepID=A0A6N2KR50_SALVM